MRNLRKNVVNINYVCHDVADRGWVGRWCFSICKKLFIVSGLLNNNYLMYFV